MNKCKDISLHVVMTSRHLLSAIAIASRWEEEDHQIIIVDQDLNDHLYLDAVLEYLKQSELFSFSAGFYKSSRGGLWKSQHRKSIFRQLDEYLECNKPKKIFVGNDRRLEFQYIASRLKGSVESIYIDEGTATYINGFGFKKTTQFIDAIFDAKLKKLVYGNWYSHPSMMGGSEYIDNAMVCFPDLVNKALQKKGPRQLDPLWFRQKQIKEFLYFYAERLDLDVLEICSIQNIFIVPHPMFLRAPSYDIAAFKCKIEEAMGQEHRVGVKYHPSQYGDPLGLSEIGVIEMPRKLPLELFLPLMQIKEAWGDVSSAVLSVKWLCPNANVYAEVIGDSKKLKFLEYLFCKVGVEIIDSKKSEGLIDNVK